MYIYTHICIYTYIFSRTSHAAQVDSCRLASAARRLLRGRLPRVCLDVSDEVLCSPLIWSTIILVIVGFGGLGAYMFVNAGQLSQNFPDKVKVPDGYGQHEETATKVIAGFLLVCSFVCLCMACCFRSSIDAACACVEVAVEAIFEMPSLLFAPILKA
ncbi:unnamed protein product, partial [Polarella glacialis]